MPSNLSTTKLLSMQSDLLIEILLKLPFHSILTCKLVSKQLKNLINDPQFYKLYPNNSVALQFGAHGLCCLVKLNANNTTDDEFPSYKLHDVPIGLGPRSPNGFLDFDLVPGGSSNAIACVKLPRDDYRFYNLITGNSYTVKGSRNGTELVCFGFGYDRYADDYKILEVFKSDCYQKLEGKNLESLRDQKLGGNLEMHSTRDDHKLDKDHRDRFSVYSFRDSCWTLFHGYPYASYESKRLGAACSFNGVLHWVVVTSGLAPRRAVLTYDLRSCTFGEMSLPIAGSNIVPIDKYGTKRVSELDGRLCYVYQTEVDLCVWVMQEYGVVESWTKLLAFVGRRTNSFGSSFEQATPAMLHQRRDGGKLVLFTRHVGDTRMFWCNVENKVIKLALDYTNWKYMY